MGKTSENVSLKNFTIMHNLMRLTFISDEVALKLTHTHTGTQVYTHTHTHTHTQHLHTQGWVWGGGCTDKLLTVPGEKSCRAGV